MTLQTVQIITTRGSKKGVEYENSTPFLSVSKIDLLDEATSFTVT